MFSSLYDPYSSAYVLNTSRIWWWQCSSIAEEWVSTTQVMAWPGLTSLAQNKVSKGEWQGSSHQSIFILHSEGATAQGPFSGGQASCTRHWFWAGPSCRGHLRDRVSFSELCLSWVSMSLGDALLGSPVSLPLWPLGRGQHLCRTVVRAEMDLILSVPFITTKASPFSKWTIHLQMKQSGGNIRNKNTGLEKAFSEITLSSLLLGSSPLCLSDPVPAKRVGRVSPQRLLASPVMASLNGLQVSLAQVPLPRPLNASQSRSQRALPRCCLSRALLGSFLPKELPPSPIYWHICCDWSNEWPQHFKAMLPIHRNSLGTSKKLSHFRVK